MAKLVFALLLLAVSTLSAGQVTFQKGYFIDNDDKRVECLIRNEDWRNNPTRFFYKENESAGSKEYGIEGAKEFGLDNGIRYLRATVDIDFSSNVEDVTQTPEGPVSQLSRQREPEWKRNQVVFLQVIVDGHADLYYWHGDNRMRFFYAVSGSAITQLIFKPYLKEIQEKNLVETVTTNRPYSAFEKAMNEDFRNQLYKEVICGKIGLDRIKKVEYKRADLRKYFVEFNTCSGAALTDYDVAAPAKRKLQLTLRPGINISSYEINTPNGFTDIYSNFPSSASFRFGVEGEYFMKFSANHWSMFAEPTYRTFSQDFARGAAKDKVSYTSIELPLGIRYNAYPNPDSRVFLNAAFVLDFPFSSEVAIQGAPTRTISSSWNFAFGIGYMRKKLSAEVRLFTSRNLLKDYIAIPNAFSNTSFVLGYTIY